MNFCALQQVCANPQLLEEATAEELGVFHMPDGRLGVAEDQAFGHLNPASTTEDL